MLDTIIPEAHRRKLKTSDKNGKKLGKCVLCGERVRTNQKYLTTGEGYTHKTCLRKWKGN